MRKDWNRKTVDDKLEDGQKRVILSVSYDGTLFNGWQSQESKDAVQDALEEAILEITGENVHIYASGRTDSGVHAISQICHFDTFTHIPSERLKYAINAHLKKGVRVSYSKETDGRFHARFSSLAREYRYYIKEMDKCTVFDENRVWGVNGVPEIDMLNSIARLIEGEHDFAFLSLKEDDGKSTKRDIYKSEFFEEKGYIIYRIIGNAFLYHQVRSLVGTIVKIAKKYKSKDEAKQAFLSIMAETKRSNVIFTAPPYGLYFYNTVYNEDEWKVLSKDIEKV